MKNLFEFVIVWTILLVLFIVCISTLFLPFTGISHFIFGVCTSLVGMFLKKTYIVFREDSKLDALFGDNHG